MKLFKSLFSFFLGLFLLSGTFFVYGEQTKTVTTPNKVEEALFVKSPASTQSSEVLENLQAFTYGALAGTVILHFTPQIIRNFREKINSTDDDEALLFQVVNLIEEGNVGFSFYSDEEGVIDPQSGYVNFKYTW